jgi:hypothetical protein
MKPFKGLSNNERRAAEAAGKKLIVLSRVDGYELVMPEDGFRMTSAFWRKRN